MQSFSLQQELCLFQTAISNAKQLLPSSSKLSNVLNTLNAFSGDIEQNLELHRPSIKTKNEFSPYVFGQTQSIFHKECTDEWIQMNFAQPKKKFNFHRELPVAKTKASYRGSYRSYSTSLKEAIWKLHQEKGLPFSQISQSFQIPIKNIARWCKFGYQRKLGAGRKVSDPQMELMLDTWIRETHEEGAIVSYKKIQGKALEFSQVNEFKASKCWLKNFMKRKNLVGKYEIGWKN